jgi:uncharacterized protein YbbK (DUF523 family)/uncharacterized protein YbgA (DUF1722 family)
MNARLRIGVSACLVGAPVRFDGGHKRDDFLVEELAPLAELVSLCPEVGVGLGTPRESLRLVRIGERTRLVAPKSGRDLTEDMERYAVAEAERIAGLDLDGYVLKKDSPSCGLERVRVYAESGIPTRSGRGLFAQALMARLPLLPVEDEGRLRDPDLRENFLQRLFVYRRLAQLFTDGWTLAQLIAFHGAAKFLLLSHSPSAAYALGRLVAGAAAQPRAIVAEQYRRGVLEAMALVPSRGRQINVLEHLAGFFKRTAADDDKRELHDTIARYGVGEVPLAVPLTLVRHHARHQRLRYLEAQLYLSLVPRVLRPELAPANSVDRRR